MGQRLREYAVDLGNGISTTMMLNDDAAKAYGLRARLLHKADEIVEVPLPPESKQAPRKTNKVRRPQANK